MDEPTDTKLLLLEKQGVSLTGIAQFLRESGTPGTELVRSMAVDSKGPNDLSYRRLQAWNTINDVFKHQPSVVAVS